MIVEIAGAKGFISDVDQFLNQINHFSNEHNLVIQVLNAEMIYGRLHLLSAVTHAVRAMETKTNTTNSLGMEVLLYASGERQLKLAIPKMGVKKGKNEIALICMIPASQDITPESLINDLVTFLNFKRDDTVLEGNRETLLRFGITEKEIETVTKHKYGNLILEKIALVDIIK